ncbi:MAG TPA: penicillin-binding transpeptidase domain-containing protein [Acidimicrobiales bacterium]
MPVVGASYRARRPVLLAVTTLTMSVGVAACGGSSSTPQATVSEFLAAWNRSDWASMYKLMVRPPEAADSPRSILEGVPASSVTRAADRPLEKGSTASTGLSSIYTLPGGIGTWQTSSTISLVNKSGRWLVDWSPSTVASGLVEGDRVVMSRSWAPRAAILGAGGAQLVSDAPVVEVGIEGSRVKDPVALTSALVAAGASQQTVSAALGAASAHPNFFEPVLTLTQAQYDQMGGNGSALYKTAGSVFKRTTQRAAITPALGAQLVGSVGPVTAEELARLGPAYGSDSTVGQTGIEQAYEKQLAGSPGATIRVVHKDGSDGATLASFSSKPGTAVTTSIDPKVQAAAEQALGGITQPGAFVAMRASTGEVLAAVGTPASSQFDAALQGRYPPGSTFKVITASALFESGLTPASPASCPPNVTIDGKPFHNAEGDSPAPTVRAAFAESCNTAFINLAVDHLQAASLPTVAAQFGLGSLIQPGLDAFAGSVPVPSDKAALAATAIGQAGVVVSPLDMATVAAAIDTGSVRAPRLIAGAGDDTATPKPLPADVVADLQSMMTDVVVSGTAAGTGLPAGTHAKTGTAEYGSGTPQPTDAWLIGYRGDIAFAMVEQGTGNGGPTDGPVVARFLKALG